MKVAVEETFAAPIEKVYEVLSDIAHAEERIAGIEKLEILSDVTSGVGLRWRETRVMFGKEATEEMEMVQCDPPNFYRVEAASHGMEYVSEYSFRALDEGSTQVSLVFSGDPISFMAKLMTPIGILFQGATRKALQQDLIDLRSAIEG